MHYEIRLKEARSRAGIDRAVLGGQIVTHSMNAAPAPMAAESPLYQMPSRSISHEQKIQPVATGPDRPLATGIIAAAQLHKTRSFIDGAAFPSRQ